MPVTRFPRILREEGAVASPSGRKRETLFGEIALGPLALKFSVEERHFCTCPLGRRSRTGFDLRLCTRDGVDCETLQFPGKLDALLRSQNRHKGLGGLRQDGKTVSFVVPLGEFPSKIGELTSLPAFVGELDELGEPDGRVNLLERLPASSTTHVLELEQKLRVGTKPRLHGASVPDTNFPGKSRQVWISLQRYRYSISQRKGTSRLLFQKRGGRIARQL